MVDAKLAFSEKLNEAMIQELKIKLERLDVTDGMRTDKYETVYRRITAKITKI